MKAESGFLIKNRKNPAPKQYLWTTSMSILSTFLRISSRILRWSSFCGDIRYTKNFEFCEFIGFMNKIRVKIRSAVSRTVFRIDAWTIVGYVRENRRRLCARSRFFSASFPLSIKFTLSHLSFSYTDFPISHLAIILFLYNFITLFLYFPPSFPPYLMFRIDIFIQFFLSQLLVIFPFSDSLYLLEYNNLWDYIFIIQFSLFSCHPKYEFFLLSPHIIDEIDI